MSDSSASASLNDRFPRSGVRRFIEEHPFLAITGAILITAAVVAGTLFLLTLAAGDEPPIRVKKGSIELHLVHSGIPGSAKKSWKKGSTAREWRIRKLSGTPTREYSNYRVLVGASNPSRCPQGTVANGTVVRFTFTETETSNTTVTLDASNRHTVVTTTNDLPDPSDDKVLTYGNVSGYISQIAVGPSPGSLTTMCTFDSTSQDPMLEVVLLDYQ